MEVAIRRARFWLMISAVLILQAFLVYFSMHYGVLTGLVQWDDSAVIARAIVNLNRLMNSQSLYELAGNAKNLDLHAPLSDLQTMFGLMIGGGQLWVPFSLNAVFVFLALYAVAGRSERTSTALFLALLVFLLTLPVTINALTYLKSDWKGGVLVAAAIFVFFEAVETNSRRLKYVGAGLLGVALISKLTVFYLPVFAFIIVVLFEIYDFLLRPPADASVGPAPGTIMSRLKSWFHHQGITFLTCAAIAVVPYCFFFALNARRLISYIRYALSDKWDDGLTVFERGTYYSPFSQEGLSVWGNLHWAFLLFTFGCAVISFVRRDYRCAAFIVVVALLAVVFTAPLLLAPTSDISFGATLYGVFIGGTLIAMCIAARSIPHWGGIIVLVIVIAMALPQKLPLSNSAYGNHVQAPTNSELRELKAIYQDIASKMYVVPASRNFSGSSRVLVFFGDMYAPEGNLTYLKFRQTGEILRVSRIDEIVDINDVRERLAEAEFALTLQSEGAESWQTFARGSGQRPEVLVTPEADRIVSELPEFERLGAWTVPQGEIRLYRNSAAF